MLYIVGHFNALLDVLQSYTGHRCPVYEEIPEQYSESFGGVQANYNIKSRVSLKTKSELEVKERDVFQQSLTSSRTTCE